MTLHKKSGPLLHLGLGLGFLKRKKKGKKAAYVAVVGSLETKHKTFLDYLVYNFKAFQLIRVHCNYLFLNSNGGGGG